MSDPILSRPRMITWEQDRQELRDEWAGMTMAERLAAAAQMTRDFAAFRGVLANEPATTCSFVRFTGRKR